MTLASRKITQTTQGVFRQKLKESWKQPRFYLLLADLVSRIDSKNVFTQAGIAQKPSQTQVTKIKQVKSQFLK